MNRPAPRPTRSLPALGGVALIAAAAFASVGCEDEQAQADQSLQNAIAQIQRAERGFPADGTDQVAYRQQSLNEAMTDLEAAADGQGDSAATAARLIAHVHASAANAKVSQALSAYARLTPEAAALLSHVAVAQIVETGTSRGTIDRDPGIAELQDAIDQTTTRRDAARASAQELQAQVNGLEARIAEHRKTAGDRLADSRRLAGEALAASSSKAAYDLEDQAGRADLASKKASIEAERVSAERTLIAARLAGENARAQQSDAAVTRLTARLEEQRQLGQIERSAADDARADRKAAIDELAGAFDVVTQQYARNVDAVLLEAVDRAQQGVSVADRATSLATGPQRQAARLDLVSARVTLGYAAAQRALTASMFRDLVTNVAQSVESLDGPLAETVGTNAADMTEVVEQATTTARASLEVAIDEANQVNAPDAADMAERAKSILDRLADVAAEG
jgi:hypothetical protein